MSSFRLKDLPGLSLSEWAAEVADSWCVWPQDGHRDGRFASVQPESRNGQQGPLRVTPRCSAMASRYQTRPEVTSHLPLLMNLAVPTIDPGGRPPAEGVAGVVVSPSFCLLVIGPLGLPGALTSAEIPVYP